MLEIVSFYYPLFMPKPFHTGNYTEITQQCGCLFYKQKSPREEALLTFEIFLVVISIGYFNDEYYPKHTKQD